MKCQACFKHEPFFGLRVNPTEDDPGERWCRKCLRLLVNEIGAGNEKNPIVVARAKAAAGPTQDMRPNLYVDKSTLRAVEILVLDGHGQPRLVRITIKLEGGKEQKSNTPA